MQGSRERGQLAPSPLCKLPQRGPRPRPLNNFSLRSSVAYSARLLRVNSCRSPQSGSKGVALTPWRARNYISTGLSTVARGFNPTHMSIRTLGECKCPVTDRERDPRTQKQQQHCRIKLHLLLARHAFIRRWPLKILRRRITDEYSK